MRLYWSNKYQHLAHNSSSLTTVFLYTQNDLKGPGRTSVTVERLFLESYLVIHCLLSLIDLAFLSLQGLILTRKRWRMTPALGHVLHKKSYKLISFVERAQDANLYFRATLQKVGLAPFCLFCQALAS